MATEANPQLQMIKFIGAVLGLLACHFNIANSPSVAQPIEPPSRFPGANFPSPIPSPLPSVPVQPLPSIPAPNQPENPSESPKTIDVKELKFEGNQVFNNEELDAIARQILKIQPGEHIGQISFQQLWQVRSAITEHYYNRGYYTSFAYIPSEQEIPITGAVIKIKVIEDKVETIEITGPEKLKDYVRSRLAFVTVDALNQERLVEALELLRLDPLIETVNAELSVGKGTGQRLLEVKVKESPEFRGQISLDNGRSPSVGSFRRGISLNENNLLGLGDSLSASYKNTDGSHEFDFGYTIPINPQNGKLGLRYRFSRNTVIEPPFDPLDILANARSYELSLSQPVIHSFDSEQRVERELVIGAILARQESDTSILGINFPLSEGANARGETRATALRFFQQWTERGIGEVFFARSELSVGIGLFGANINSNAPDSRFVLWRGQAQWLRQIAPDTLLLLRSSLQLADRPLLGLEQFGLGGTGSVRGYRQDVRLADNGLLVSAEVQLPVYSDYRQQQLLSVVPFFDVGTVWNSSERTVRSPITLIGTGLGLQWQEGENLRVRLDYGIPLVNGVSRGTTWQDNGVYFTVEYNFF